MTISFDQMIIGFLILGALTIPVMAAGIHLSIWLERRAKSKSYRLELQSDLLKYSLEVVGESEKAKAQRQAIAADFAAELNAL